MNQALQHGHLDPDQLNAFAEGVLPEHERLVAMAHLAECPRCREVIFLAQQAIAAEAPAVVQEPARISFWKRWLGPLPLAGAAAFACALVAVVMWRSHPTAPPSAGSEVAVNREQPRVAPQPATGVANKPESPQPAKAEPPKPVPAVSASMDMATKQLAAPPPPVQAPNTSIRMPEQVVVENRASGSPGTPAKALPEPKLVAGLAEASQAQDAKSRPLAVAPQAPTEKAGIAAPVPAAAVADASAASGGLRDQAAQTPSVARRSSSPAPAASAGVSANGMVLQSAPRLDLLSGATGTVTDASGAAISGVSVTLRSPTKPNAPWVATTNALGQFTFSTVPPGKYQLELAAPGFKSQTQTLDLQKTQVAQVMAKLAVGAATETVTVDAAQISVMPSKAERRTASCDDPLPSGKPGKMCQIAGKKTLAVDDDGVVFVRRGNSRWKAVKISWTGHAKTIGVTGNGFELVTDSGATWFSKDGEHWSEHR